jgi:hypothetical protein
MQTEEDEALPFRVTDEDAADGLGSEIQDTNNAI